MEERRPRACAASCTSQPTHVGGLPRHLLMFFRPFSSTSLPPLFCSLDIFHEPGHGSCHAEGRAVARRGQARRCELVTRLSVDLLSACAVLCCCLCGDVEAVCGCWWWRWGLWSSTQHSTRSSAPSACRSHVRYRPPACVSPSLVLSARMHALAANHSAPFALPTTIGPAVSCRSPTSVSSLVAAPRGGSHAPAPPASPPTASLIDSHHGAHHLPPHGAADRQEGDEDPHGACGAGGPLLPPPGALLTPPALPPGWSGCCW
jgi:hypothetical protein